MKTRKWIMAVFAIAGLSLFGDTRTVGGKEYVYLLTPDTSDVAGQNSVVLGTRWSDGIAPNPASDYLVDLGAGNFIRACANWGALAFGGKSLTLGVADGNAGWLYLAYCRPFAITNLYCVNGGIRFNSGSVWSSLTSTNMTIQTTADDPFIVEASGRNEFNLNASVFGGSDAALLIRATDGAGYSSDIFRVKNDNEYLVFTNYYGKIIVEGTNVYFGVTHNSMAYLPSCVFGLSSGDAFVADALTLRSGGAFELSSAHAFPFAAGNRGIRIGEGGGGLVMSSASLDGRVISAEISGPGVLSVKGGVTFWDGTLDCGGLFVASNGAVRIDDTMVWGDGMTLEVAAGGTFVGTAAEMRPARTVLHGGAKVVLGVANGVRYVNFGNPQLFRPIGWTVGTLRLSLDSVLSLDGQPLSLQLEDDGVGAVYAGRIPLMRVPTSVRTLAASDFTLLAANGTASTRAVEIVTEGGEQVVYAVPGSSVYVVPSGTAGNTPTEPYDTWATAATNLAAAITSADVGDTVRVAPGVYYTANELTLTSAVTIVSDDGSGALATETTIFDGGGADAAAGHRLFNLSAAGACLYGLSLRNGYTSGSGAGVLLGSAGAAVLSCVITNCVATNSAYGAFGGGIYMNNVSAEVHDTRIVGCRANSGGGAAAYSSGAIRTAYGTSEGYPRFNGCAFVANEATKKDGSAVGGGFSIVANAAVWFERCTFAGNWTTSTDNSGSSARRGAAAEVGQYSIITNCVFDGNGSGYRALLNYGPQWVMNCVFRNNTSDAMVGDGNAKSLIENCVFTNNTSQLFYSMTHLRNCLYAYNANPLTVSGSVTIENCTIVSNRCGGIYLASDTAKSAFTNCISAYNQAGSIANSRGRPNFYFSKNAYATNVTVVGCCLQGITGMVNDNHSGENWDLVVADKTGKSIDADPLFVNVVAGDWRLKAKSPCRDRGVALEWMAAGTDLDGNPRLLDYNGKATADALPDIGCYECFERTLHGTMVIMY